MKEMVQDMILESGVMSDLVAVANQGILEDVVVEGVFSLVRQVRIGLFFPSLPSLN